MKVAVRVAEYRGEVDGREGNAYTPPSTLDHEVLDAYRRGFHRGMDERRAA